MTANTPPPNTNFLFFFNAIHGAARNATPSPKTLFQFLVINEALETATHNRGTLQETCDQKEQGYGKMPPFFPLHFNCPSRTKVCDVWPDHWSSFLSLRSPSVSWRTSTLSVEASRTGQTSANQRKLEKRGREIQLESTYLCTTTTTTSTTTTEGGRVQWSYLLPLRQRFRMTRLTNPSLFSGSLTSVCAGAAEFFPPFQVKKEIASRRPSSGPPRVAFSFSARRDPLSLFPSLPPSITSPSNQPLPSSHSFTCSSHSFRLPARISVQNPSG